MKNLNAILILLVLIAVSSCKPTEKNYKAAYDAALGKRESAMADIDVNLPAGSLQQVDGPHLKEVDGVKVYLLNRRLKPEVPGIPEMKLPGRYNVAVGTYKMNTNCIAQAEALKEEGYQAFAAKDTEGEYYTVAGSFLTLEEAVKFYQEYQSGNNRVYVGLPSSPVIIFSPM